MSFDSASAKKNSTFFRQNVKGIQQALKKKISLKPCSCIVNPSLSAGSTEKKEKKVSNRAKRVHECIFQVFSRILALYFYLFVIYTLLYTYIIYIHI